MKIKKVEKMCQTHFHMSKLQIICQNHKTKFFNLNQNAVLAYCMTFYPGKLNINLLLGYYRGFANLYGLDFYPRKYANYGYFIRFSFCK